MVLAVQGLSLAQRDPFGTTLNDIGFEVRAGEIVGVAGVSGNGQQELMAALSGEDTRAPAGSITPVRQGHRGALAAPAPPRGPALRARGAAGPRRGADAEPGAEHAADAHRRRCRAAAGSRTGARAARWPRTSSSASTSRPAGRARRRKSLSGGNLQKFIVGREIDADPKLLIVAQPTWGVDVGAAALIRGELLKLRDAGCALLVVSEELDELFEISDRLVVIAKGACRRRCRWPRPRSSRSAPG